METCSIINNIEGGEWTARKGEYDAGDVSGQATIPTTSKTGRRVKLSVSFGIDSQLELPVVFNTKSTPSTANMTSTPNNRNGDDRRAGHDVHSQDPGAERP